MIETIAKFDPFLNEHIKKHGNPGKGHQSYLSATICDEFIRLMGNTVLQKITAEIKSNKYFSIIVDSTPDISHSDQLSIIIRYVNIKGQPVERFMTFVPNIGHKAPDMLEAVTQKLHDWGIDIMDCRGQSYDNAYNMSGKYAGLQAKIREINPLALFVPCAGHSLNLVGNHAVESSSTATSFFLMCQAIYNFFALSTHRWEILEGKTTRTLKGLSQTRWSARYDACLALKEDWTAILESLNIIEQDNNEKPGSWRIINIKVHK